MAFTLEPAARGSIEVHDRPFSLESALFVLLQLAEIRCAQQLLVGDMLKEAGSRWRELSEEAAYVQHLVSHHAADVTLRVGMKVRQSLLIVDCNAYNALAATLRPLPYLGGLFSGQRHAVTR